MQVGCRCPLLLTVTLCPPHVLVSPQGHVLPRLPLQPVPGPRAQGVSGAAGDLRQGRRR